MSTYDVIEDFNATPGANYITVDPYWLVVVFRLKFPTTFNHKTQSSITDIFSDAVEIRGKPLIITDDCISLQINSNKDSYVQSLSAILLDSGLNYLSEIFPGDYVLAWMFNNKNSYQSVLDRLQRFGPNQSGGACNRFKDGFKFVGKVQSIRKSLIQNAEGPRTVRYNINGIAFDAFDAQMFFEPHLALDNRSIGEFFAHLDVNVNKIIGTFGTGIQTDDAIPIFLDLMLGRGIPPNLGVEIADPRLHATAGLEAGHSYIVPQAIGQILGKSESSQELLRYADILEAIIGIQNYSGIISTTDLIGFDNPNFDEVDIARSFSPDGTRNPASKRFTPHKNLGTFLPAIPQFTNKNVWSVLQQYLNTAVNEMYTTLRVNPNGLVVPTLVVRQLPFTTPLYQNKATTPDLIVTRFLELPRWGIDPILVKQVDFGRSDAMRHNFIHIYGEGVDHNQPFSSQIIVNPPIRDDLDIARSGLRSHMQTVPCYFGDVREGGPAAWMTLKADILMAQQLTLTGIMNTIGIQSPICVGDNLEWDGIVFHIESVSHTCTIGGSGAKSFSTSLSLTHGVNVTNATEDLNVFAGIHQSDQRTFNPGTTVDNANQVLEPSPLENANDAIVPNLSKNGGLA